MVGTSNGLFTTDASGIIHLPNLATDTYVIREVIAPDGYILDGEPQTIKLIYGETHKVTFYNAPLGGLTIVKTDTDTGERIKGAVFEVRKLNGELIGNYTTNSNGTINITDLSSGWYEVTETQATSGYILDSTPHQVEVKEGQTATLTVENHKQSGITIRKVDADSGVGLYGAVFLLYDPDGNPIGEYTSDNNGFVFIDGLEDGRYKIREITAPEGYILDSEYKTITVSYGKSPEIIWQNTAIKGQIQITKTSADYNSTNGLPAGSLLQGAVFEIYNRAGNLVDAIVSGSNGLAASQPLPLGIYTIREVTAPDHYSVYGSDITAYLEYEGQILRLEVANKSVNTGVSILKTGPFEVMSSQPMTYQFSSISNTSNVSLQNFYWRDYLPWEFQMETIVTGTYNVSGTYKIVYRVNDGDYQVLADNLSTMQNYTLAACSTALGLASNERVTEVMFVFGQVPAGFTQTSTPSLSGTSRSGLVGNTSFVNVAEVGGLHNGLWIQSVTRWVTTVYGTVTELPRTGY